MRDKKEGRGLAAPALYYAAPRVVLSFGLPLLLLLPRGGDDAQLLHHAQLVEVVPALHHLALIGEAEDPRPRNRDPPAGGRDAPKLAPVGPAHRPARHHLVPLGDLVLYGRTEVGEGPAELAHEPLDVLGTPLEDGAVGLVGAVALEDLLRQVQVTLVADLLHVAPERGLVPFCRHAAPPLLAPLLRRWTVASRVLSSSLAVGLLTRPRPPRSPGVRSCRPPPPASPRPRP